MWGLYVFLSIVHLAVFVVALVAGEVFAGIALGLVGCLAWAFVAYMERNRNVRI